MLQKKVLIPIIGAVTVGSTLFGVSFVEAQGTPSTIPSIVQRIAQRFNLNQSDVQKVFDEQKTEMHAQKKAELETRLNQAVKDGKITDTQKQAILTKFGEMSAMHSNKEQPHNMAPEQRQQEMQQKQTELESWAAKNGLTLQTLQELVSHGGKGFGMKGYGWHGGSTTTTPSPSTGQ
jgi:hypothetical protein